MAQFSTVLRTVRPRADRTKLHRRERALYHGIAVGYAVGGCIHPKAVAGAGGVDGEHGSLTIIRLGLGRSP